MRFQVLRWAAATLLIGVGVSAHAQTVTGEVSYNGGLNYTALPGSPFPAATPITVNLNSVTSEVFVRFKSQLFNGNLSDLGPVTINGTPGGIDALVSVLVAGLLNTFPELPRDPIEVQGVRDVQGIAVTDEGLRTLTRVCIAATGNQTGEIRVGHVFKMQFNGITLDNIFTGGEIRANVTATAGNDSRVTGTGAFFDHDNDPVTPNIEVHNAPISYVRGGWHFPKSNHRATARRGGGQCGLRGVMRLSVKPRACPFCVDR